MARFAGNVRVKGLSCVAPKAFNVVASSIFGGIVIVSDLKSALGVVPTVSSPAMSPTEETSALDSDMPETLSSGAVMMFPDSIPSTAIADPLKAGASRPDGTIPVEAAALSTMAATVAGSRTIVSGIGRLPEMGDKEGGDAPADVGVLNNDGMGTKASLAVWLEVAATVVTEDITGNDVIPVVAGVNMVGADAAAGTNMVEDVGTVDGIEVR